MSILTRGGWVLALGLALAAPSLAQKPARPSKQKAESYQIVQLDDAYQVMKKSEIAAFKKQLEVDYKAAVEAHREARKAAAKEKRKFTDPPPKRPQVKVHGKSFKSEAEAQAEIEKQEAKKKGRSGKGSGR
jgi:hypothetical protein